MKIEEAVEKTVAYAKKFGMELSFDELSQRLMGKRMFKKEEIERAVEKMGLKLKKQIRRETEKKMEKAIMLAKMIIEKNKDILFLGVTGSVAGGKAKKNDDIDMMVICKKNRLWLCRVKLMIFLIKNKIKHRRAGGKEKKDAFCFNLWLEEKSLKIPRTRQNKKTAIDLVLIKAMVNKEKIFERFLQENIWVKKWVATGYKNKERKVERETEPGEKKNIGLDMFNLLLFGGQYLYMKPKMRGEVVDLKRAFFHRQ